MCTYIIFIYIYYSATLDHLAVHVCQAARRPRPSPRTRRWCLPLAPCWRLALNTPMPVLWKKTVFWVGFNCIQPTFPGDLAYKWYVYVHIWLYLYVYYAYIYILFSNFGSPCCPRLSGGETPKTLAADKEMVPAFGALLKTSAEHPHAGALEKNMFFFIGF